MAIYNFRTIKEEMNRGVWHQAYLFYGPEKYLVKQLVEGLQKAFITPGMEELDLVRIRPDGDLKKADLERLKQELDTPAFLSKRKVIIMEETGLFDKAEKSRDLADDFLAAIASLNPGSCLVLIEQQIDGRRKKLLKAWADQEGAQVEVKPEETAVLLGWLQAKAQKKKLGLSRQAGESLIDRCDSDMTQLDQELTKALLYAEYAGLQGIDLNLINMVCRDDLHGRIFDLTDAIAAGKAKEALDLLDVLLQLKEPLPLIRFMLNRQLKQLICAKELGQASALAGQLKVQPFVAKRLIGQARKLKLSDLEYLYRLSFLSDWQVKQGQMADDLAFESLIVEASLYFNQGKVT